MCALRSCSKPLYFLSNASLFCLKIANAFSSSSSRPGGCVDISIPLFSLTMSSLQRSIGQTGCFVNKERSAAPLVATCQSVHFFHASLYSFLPVGHALLFIIGGVVIIPVQCLQRKNS